MSAVAKTMRVLVGYASRFGSTRDIATRIADAVRAGGSEVDVRSVDDISDLDCYDAIVFGAGVYDGSWIAEATALMRREAAVLARKPLWLLRRSEAFAVPKGLPRCRHRPVRSTQPQGIEDQALRGPARDAPCNPWILLTL
jgi:flavodoxin-like protein